MELHYDLTDALMRALPPRWFMTNAGRHKDKLFMNIEVTVGLGRWIAECSRPTGYLRPSALERLRWSTNANDAIKEFMDMSAAAGRPIVLVMSNGNHWYISSYAMSFFDRPTCHKRLALALESVANLCGAGTPDECYSSYDHMRAHAAKACFGCGTKDGKLLFGSCCGFFKFCSQACLTKSWKAGLSELHSCKLMRALAIINAGVYPATLV